MSFSLNDIQFLLSGGPTNTDPLKSLGGYPSTKILGNGVDFLFNRVSQDNMVKGNIDYRCTYMLNRGDSTLQSLKVFLTDLSTVDPAQLHIGILVRNEIQNIIFSGPPTGGSFMLTYTAPIGGVMTSQTTNSIPWNSDINVLAASTQAALNALLLLGGVTVAGAGSTLSVTFAGTVAARAQQLLQFTNSLTGGTAIINRMQGGSPINAITQDTGFTNQVPFGITFSQPTTLDMAIAVGDIGSLDLFPIWLRRTVPANTTVPVDTIGSWGIRLSATVVES